MTPVDANHAALRAPATAAPEAEVLADLHRGHLLELIRLPIDPEYITPHEVLRLVQFSYLYDVDFTEGLEPNQRTTGRYVAGQHVRFFMVPRSDVNGEVRRVRVACRVRLEPLLDDPCGVWIPDATILWGQQLIGRLKNAAAARLESLADRRRGQ